VTLTNGASRHDKDEGIRWDATLESIGSVKTAGGRPHHGRHRQPDLRRRGRRDDRQRASAQALWASTPIARIHSMTVTAGDPVIMLEEPIPPP
jgi:acetyl-CoA C-acetyltransferase